MTEKPLVTVAMPVFNAGRYLRAAVLSIIRQSFTDWELLIIDDGSTDGAVDLLADITESRIIIVRDGENKGLAARLNEAVDRSRGKYFARMDQDDVSYPERFERQVNMLEQHPEIDLCAVCCVTINTNDELIGALPRALGHEEICARPWLGFYLPHPTWMGRTGWFRRHGYASPGPYFCEDQELILRTFQVSRFATLPETLFAYRIRDRINWLKLTRTRSTLLGEQLSHFWRDRQIGSMLCSLLAYCERIATDTLSAAMQYLGRPGIRFHEYSPINSDDQSRWCAVRKSVSEVSAPPPAL
ncbi:MAG: glycosyltransferase family 2 protein [Sulfuritalea sp.]|nr:glycosyltransferase family 2 protein [Sulfuritalea sp.]